MSGPYLKRIDDAIDSYADRAGGGGDGAAPYNSESLAEIYAPRVQELFDLQAAGFTYAEWKWDAELGENRWHGLSTAEVEAKEADYDQAFKEWADTPDADLWDSTTGDGIEDT